MSVLARLRSINTFPGPFPCEFRVELYFFVRVLYVHFPRSDCEKAKAISWRRTRRLASPAAWDGERAVGRIPHTPRPCQRGAARRFPQARSYESAGGQRF